ncbi:MAG: MopE-related protein [Thermoanaerobaculia bacterium]
MNDKNRKRLHQLLAALPAAALLVAVFAGSMLQPQQAWSDDRDLLGSGGEKPYVFFLIDISSSMLRMISTGANGAFVPNGLDDPESKIFIAKKAVYEVVQQVGNNALYGFGTYDINSVQYNDKHWIYTPQSNPSWLSRPEFSGGSDTRPWRGPGTSEMAYPRVGHPLTFGDHTTTGNDGETPELQSNHEDGSCAFPETLDVLGAIRGEMRDVWTDVEGMGKLMTFEKMGREGSTETTQWFLYKGEKYRLIWKALAGGQSMGDVPMNVQVDFQRLSNGNCSSPAYEDIAMNETLVMVPLHPTDLDGDPLPGAPSSMHQVSDERAMGYSKGDFRGDKACDNNEYWNSSYDELGQTFTYDAIQDPLHRDPVGEALGLGHGVFDRGDVIPFDWTNPGYTVGNRQEILRRLAPSILLGQPPDFRVSPYFKEYDPGIPGIPGLKDAFADYPPIITSGDTPIEGSVFRFRQWYDKWITIAMNEDPGWDCRAGVALIMLTDGAGESCGEYAHIGAEYCEGALSPCPTNENEGPNVQAEILYDGVFPAGHPLAGDRRDVKTYVIGFATAEPNLNNMAEAGGTCSDRNGDTVIHHDTECAYYAWNKDDLVSSMLNIFTEIQAEPRSFVPAATPPRSFNLDPKTVLTNFVPVPGESTWDGHLNAFLSPIPLTIDGRPNTARKCNGTTITEACFLWDAGEELEDQTPTAAEVSLEPPTLKLGPGADERRVFFTMEQDILYPEAIPQPRRLLDWTATTSPTEWQDVVDGMGIGGPPSICGDATCDPGENSCNCAADCGAPPANEVGLCADAFDNDCDGFLDCIDPDCSAEPLCSFCGDSSCDLGEDKCNCAVDCGAPPGSEAGLCTDTQDNDCDTFADCGDSDCAPDPACAFCGDGPCGPGENMCNCAVDCGAPPAGEIGMCGDSLDNDCDGAVDCTDSECTIDPLCMFCGNSVCDPGENSCNCAGDCGAPPGSEVGMCTDGFDNDCDGVVDCYDPVDCSTDPSCIVCGDLVCSPGEDICSCSTDCGLPPSSEAGFCTDSLDNDCDGDIDCADSDCTGGSEVGLCSDGVDNDCDGFVDCDDSADCSTDPACSIGSCTAPGSVVLQIPAPVTPFADGGRAVDDIEQDRDGSMRIGSSDIDIDVDMFGAFLFRAVDVPDGAIIDTAVLDLMADNDWSNAAELNIFGEATADAAPFVPDGTPDVGPFPTIDYDISNRTWTTASVDWFPGTWISKDRYVSPDISDIVQEIIEVPGWAALNDMVFIIDSPSPYVKREVYSAEQYQARGAILRIDYSCPAGKPAMAAAAPPPPSAAPEVDRAKNIIRQTLRLKTGFIPDPSTGGSVAVDYILGDIFHSDPTVVGVPENGRFYASDLFSTNAFDCTDNPGYRCYFDRHQYRRQVLLTGANDGQIHSFDLATYDYTADPAKDGEFNNGTGRELFAYVPRDVLPNLVQQAESVDHDWDVDNPIRIADVFIDPAHDGTPTVDDREWRTVGIGGLRRGGRVVWALDMTQPDVLDSNGVGVPINGYVPSCWDTPSTPDVDGSGGDPCGPVAYGTSLWEFTDTWDEDTPVPPTSGTAYPDLGDTWSIVNTGLLRVLVDDGAGGTEEAIKFVAVFGGGLESTKQGRSGNWLYMVDIETGLTIYKRRLSGSAASEPAAVDTDGNGFLDTIYIGTIDGYLYKADISTPKELETTTVNDYSEGSPPPTVRTVDRVIDAAWDPFPIFDTGGRPIYFPPSVIFVGKTGLFSVAFGTGDREDIIAFPAQVPRFYNIVDNDFTAGHPLLPLTENELKKIPYNTTVKETVDLLVAPPAGKELGWALTLGTNDKVVTKSLAFGGIITFSTFTPEVTDTEACGTNGSGKVFIIDASNANPVHEDGAGDEVRYFEVADLVTSPYVEPGAPPSADDDPSLNNPCAGLLPLTERLKSLFPPSCKFTNRTKNIMAQRSDTGVECIAPVPVCVDGRNWKEY